MRLLRGEAPDKETFVLDVPAVQIVFQHDGLARRVEWRCAGSAGEECCPSDERCTRGDTTISVTVDAPGSIMTTIGLEGLVLVDSTRTRTRQIEPFKITDVLNLGRSLSTTESSVLSYRTFDREGAPTGTAMTRAAASFTDGSGLHLFFRCTDPRGNPGRVSVFADVEDKVVAPWRSGKVVVSG